MFNIYILKRLIALNLKRLWLYFYRLGNRLGVHIIPVHYYSPLPDLDNLEKTQNIWAKKSDLIGIDLNLSQQIQTLTDTCLSYQSEYVGNSVYQEGINQGLGQGYGYIEAQALWGVIRHFKPQKVIEIGSGISSYCLLKALQKNQTENHLSFQLTCIEPYPNTPLKELSNINLISQPVQTINTNFFENLEVNDLLFIDSSHTVKPASDVNYLILEVLPRLTSGVIVHFHDIFLPYDYPRNTLQTFFPWMETALLHAFLINNSRFKILFCLSYLHYKCPEKLKVVFPNYRPQLGENGLRNPYYKPFENPPDVHFPSSIYLQVL